MLERIVIAGGGTGGHLFSGVAIVEELRRRNPGAKVLYIGTDRGIEARLLPAQGERCVLLKMRPLKGRSVADRVAALALVPWAVARSVRELNRFRPQVVIGVGGYAAGPVVLAASLLGIPVALVEQNSYVGLTNRLLAPFVGRAYLAFAEAKGIFSGQTARVYGNPLRRAFLDVARLVLSDPSGVEARAQYVLVLGGSQGSRALNQVVPRILAEAGLADTPLTVVHQTGAAMQAEVQALYQQYGIRADVRPFIDDIARMYAGATLIIARAGATTLAELCAIGRPAVLVPFPAAADDHQLKNALALQAAGAAIVFDERNLDRTQFVETTRQLLRDGQKRQKMAEAARRLGRLDASAAVVDDLIAWLDPADAKGKLRSHVSTMPEVADGNAPTRTNDDDTSLSSRIERNPSAHGLSGYAVWQRTALTSRMYV